MASEQDKLKAQNKELKERVSEQDRLYELRGRELTAARKKAAKVDDAKAELAEVKDELDACKKACAACERDKAELQARVDRVDGVLEDVAALKRLVGQLL